MTMCTVKYCLQVAHLVFPESCTGHEYEDRLVKELSPTRLSWVGRFAPSSVSLLLMNLDMSSSTSTLPTSTIISNNSLEVVVMHSLRRSIVGFRISSNCGIIRENLSREAIILQSRPDFFGGLSNSDILFWSSQSKSLTKSGRC